MLRSGTAILLAAASGVHACPGSPAFIHAKADITTIFATNSCDEVQSEIAARIAGKNGWVDPHNHGTYTLLSKDAGKLTAQRVTGNKKFTDKMDFTFTSQGQGCKLEGCSESQVTSVADFSTNFCNLHDLYCGSADGCPTSGADFVYDESVHASLGAGTDKSACIVKPPLQDVCCHVCELPKVRYYSVDMAHNHCGECCMEPGKFALFKLFEKNLTLSDGTTCADLGFPIYDTTVTHGFGPVSMTLDLYNKATLVTSSKICPPVGFDTQGALEGGFDLKWYTSAKWYTQQQMIVSYLPKDYLYCVTAQYTLLQKPSLLGYEVEVSNHAENMQGKSLGPITNICAKIVDEAAGKLKVAPCFLPQTLAGDYWVVAFDKSEGWALVSGGPPSYPGQTAGCRTGTGTNGSGLWIFTRAQLRDESIINKARDAAAAKGFDLTVLVDIDQSKCAASEATMLI